jgi:hypothetical protein
MTSHITLCKPSTVGIARNFTCGLSLYDQDALPQ